MLISRSNLSRDAMVGEVAVVTGAGRGIGYEAARALAWLGASVVVAEVDEVGGRRAQESIEAEFGRGRALFVKTDVGDEASIKSLADKVIAAYGKVDVVLNNATIFPIGAVVDKEIEDWDRSYRVNLRGPVLLAKTFLPDMIKRRHGVFVCVSSSGAAPYMGAYEVFKTAQVELANTLAAEMEDKGVKVFTIGPGIVRTPGFEDGGSQVAAHMGITLEKLLEINKNVQISPEEAGVGFAASIALASKYHGQEIISLQVLRDIGISFSSEEEKQPPQVNKQKAMEAYQKVISTYHEQSEGWKERSLFERQWVFRDFKKHTGMSVDEMSSSLEALKSAIEGGGSIPIVEEPLKKLSAYYEHQMDLLKGFEKDKRKMEENLAIMRGWIADIQQLLSSLGS